MAGFKAAFKVEWPDNANRTYETVAPVNLDIIRIANIDCVMQTRYFSGFAGLFFGPIFMVIVMQLFYSCRRRLILKDLAHYEAHSPHGSDCARKRLAMVDPSGPKRGGSGDGAAGGEKGVVHQLSNKMKRALFRNLHSTMKLRVWTNFSAVPDFDPVLKQHRLCDCIPRDPHSDDPSPEQLCKRGKIQWKLLSFKTRVLQVLLLLLLSSYAPLAQKTLGLWNCTSIGDKWYLVADHKVRCLDNSEWWTYAIWGAVSALMYILGIPALFYYLVHREKVKHVEWYLNYIFDPKLSVEKAKQLATENGTAQVREDAYGISEMSKRDVKRAKMKDARQKSVLSLHQMKKKGTAFRRSIPLPLVGLLNFFIDEDVTKRVERNYNWAERRHEIHTAVEMAHKDTVERKLPWYSPRTPQEKMRVIRRYLYRRNLEATWTTKRLGFIFHSYKLEYWWYELVVMFFKLLMNGVIIFFTTVQLQIVVGVLTAFIGVSLQLRLQPYKSRSDNRVAMAMLSTLYFIMFLGLLVFIQRTLRTTAANTALEIIGFCVIAVTVVAIGVLAHQIRAEIKENRPVRNWRRLRTLLMFGTSEFHDTLDMLRQAEYVPPESERKKKMKARLRSVTHGVSVRGGLGTSGSLASMGSMASMKGGAGGSEEAKAPPAAAAAPADHVDERDVKIVASDVDMEAIPKTKHLL